ncbi:hypothetical protein RRG08_046744 [Elysia crispata]|uniref:Uncharacterized protein n=1 Tax=Elysia crispata TaxID=231223 RepID=A0AAE0ZVE8_9GAST|nr:hypothetical protein RRG08_046744 [Elysia crispata]
MNKPCESPRSQSSPNRWHSLPSQKSQVAPHGRAGSLAVEDLGETIGILPPDHSLFPPLDIAWKGRQVLCFARDARSSGRRDIGPREVLSTSALESACRPRFPRSAALKAVGRCFSGRRFVINIDGTLIASIEKMRARRLSGEIKQEVFFAAQIGCIPYWISGALKRGGHCCASGCARRAGGNAYKCDGMTGL